MTALTARDWTLPAAPERIADMRARLNAARLPQSAIAGWSGGVDLDWLAGFASYLAKDCRQTFVSFVPLRRYGKGWR